MGQSSTPISVPKNVVKWQKHFQASKLHHQIEYIYKLKFNAGAEAQLMWMLNAECSMCQPNCYLTISHDNMP